MMTGPDRMGPRSLLRTLAALGALNAALAAGLAVGLLRRDRRLGNDLALSWGFASFLAAAGVRLNVVGEHNLWAHRPAVFVINHQSGLDALIVGALLRRGFSALGKQEGKFSPAMYLLGKALDAVFVDRTDSEKGREAQAQLVERLRCGLSVFVAPEGTRSATGELGSFRTGAFHVARTAGVPLFPVVLRNAYELMPGKAKTIRPGAVDVAVLDAIPTDGWTAETVRDEIATVRKQFIDTLANWPREPR